MRWWRMVVAAVVLAASLGTPRPVRAEFAEDAGWGLLTVLGNLGYMPAKTVYSLMGGLTGGLAYVCTGGDLDTASAVWSMAMGGTYVLTPAMIRGEAPIAFAGGATEPEHAGPDVGSEASPAPATGRREEELPAS